MQDLELKGRYILLFLANAIAIVVTVISLGFPVTSDDNNNQGEPTPQPTLTPQPTATPQPLLATDIDSVSSSTLVTSTTTYTVLQGLIITTNIKDIDSTIQVTGQVTFESDGGGDSSCEVAIFQDGSQVINAAEFSDDNSPDEPGHVSLTWWTKGLSSGSHFWDLRWRTIQDDCSTLSGIARSLQVVEFKPGG